MSRGGPLLDKPCISRHIIGIIPRHDVGYDPGWSQSGRQAHSGVRFVAVVDSSSSRLVEPVFFQFLPQPGLSGQGIRVLRGSNPSMLTQRGP